MTTPIRERAYHDVSKDFETVGVHRLAQIDRLYDPFEGEIDPVTVTAVDPETGEPLAVFSLDSDGSATDLMEASTEMHVLTSAALEAAAPKQRASSEGFSGITLNGMLIFIEEQLDAGIPIESTLKAWTNDDGTINKLGVVTP